MVRRLFALSIVFGLMSVGCANGGTGFYISGLVSTNDTCEYDVGNPLIANPRLDINSGAPYVAALLYNSQLVDPGGPLPAANPNVITIQRVQVNVLGLDGAAAGVPGFSLPASGAVGTSDGMSAFQAIGTAILLPADYAATLGPGFVALEIQATGQTLGGETVITPPFQVVLEICAGCLVGCATDGEGLPVCSPSCTPGQDDLHISCLSDASCSGPSF